MAGFWDRRVLVENRIIFSSTFGVAAERKLLAWRGFGGEGVVSDLALVVSFGVFLGSVAPHAAGGGREGLTFGGG